jgi:hypothetical protein
MSTASATMTASTGVQLLPKPRGMNIILVPLGLEMYEIIPLLAHDQRNAHRLRDWISGTMVYAIAE